MGANVTVKEELIQKQILQAAKQLFAVHGLAKVTMDDVAKAIGKGRSSLYYYYKSRDEVFDAVVNMEINETLSSVEKAVDRATTAEGKFNAFCTAKLKVAKEKGSFFNALEAGMDADALTHFNKTKIALRELIMKREGALLTRLVLEGIKNRELARIEKSKLDNFIFILLGSLHGLKRLMAVENHKRAIDTVAAQFTSLVMRGLGKDDK
jgi:AcrR family transcriptional regulator